MTRSAHNRATADVFVLPAESLKFLDSALEFEVGTELALPLGLYYGANRQLFTRCHLLPYHIQLSDEAQIFKTAVVAASGTGDGCAGVLVSAAKVAHTKLGAELRLPGLGGKPAVVLTDKVTVASFLPLKPLSPASGETVLAVESSRQGIRTDTK